MREFPVVVADDDASTLKLLDACLSKAGFKVFTCVDGNQAINLVERHKPVILLADWNMAEITGLELCEQIRNSALGDNVYAMLITGNSEPNQIALGLDAGADDYLVKPVHLNVLLARVRVGERVLELRARQRQYTRNLESEIAKRKRAERAAVARTAELEQQTIELERSRRTLINMNEHRAIALQESEFLRNSAEELGEELCKARDFATNIIGSMIEMLVVIAPDGRLVKVNESTCRLLGYQEKELIGNSVIMLFCLPDELEEQAENHAPDGPSQQAQLPKQAVLRRLVEGGTVSNIEQSLLAKDGHRIPVLLSSAVMRDNDGAICGSVCVASDITERKRLEAVLLKSNKDLIAVNEVHKTLFACQSSREIAMTLTETLVSKFNAYFARVWLIRSGDLCSQCALSEHCPEKKRCLHLIASSGHYTHIDGDHQRVPLGAFNIGLIAQGRGKTICNDVVNDERMHDRAWAAQHGLQSFVGLPLIQDGKVIGVMAMFSAQILPPHILETLELLSKLGSAAFRKVAKAEALLDSEEKFKSISAAAQDAIIMMDGDGNITYWNEAAEAIFGYASEEVIGQRLHAAGLIVPERFYAAHHRGWLKFQESGHGAIIGQTTEVAGLRKNGEEFPGELSLSAVRIKNRWHSIGILRDITKRKKAEVSLRKTESELRKHRDHLEELVSERTADLAKINDFLIHEIEERREAEQLAAAASSAKGDFLATMSHELRTPLNGIIGMTELLLGSGLTRQQKKQAGLVKASGDILLRLINDILDFSKIEAGKLELENTDFDLRDSIECVATLLRSQAEQKGLALTVGVSPAVATAVRGDPGRLQQILTNLVSNAIKFTEHGQISIRAAVDDDNESSVLVRISITDTGIGIPADKQDCLFQSFSQLDASHSRRFGGTGLGLAISKQLVEMMGGEIGAISEPERGSTFWFSVALEKDRDTGTTLHIPNDVRRIRILAVDDNATNREILTEQLAGFGMAHEIVQDGEHALTVLRRAASTKNSFALAIIDLQMPGMDGEQLARTIKSDPIIANTILLLLTSAGIAGDEERMQALGFSGWLSKPIRQSQLLDAITQAMACARGNAHHELVELADSNQPSTWRLRTTDANILAVEDNEIGQEVLRQVLTQAGITHEIVADGRQAIDAWSNGHFDLILMDCQMPNMDGFAATREIRRIEKEDARNNSAPPRIPIVALTANALKGDREKCLEAGMDNHIAKPFDPAQLIEAIQSQLAIKETPDMTYMDSGSSDRDYDDLIDSHASGDCADDISSPFEMDTVVKRWGGDRGFAEKLIDKFLAAAPSELEQLIKLVNDQDVGQTTSMAHGLKGAAAYCGAERFRASAARLEQLGRAGDLNGADKCLDELISEMDRCLRHRPVAVNSNETPVDSNH